MTELQPVTVALISMFASIFAAVVYVDRVRPWLVSKGIVPPVWGDPRGE